MGKKRVNMFEKTFRINGRYSNVMNVLLVNSHRNISANWLPVLQVRVKLFRCFFSRKFTKALLCHVCAGMKAYCKLIVRNVSLEISIFVGQLNRVHS